MCSCSGTDQAHDCTLGIARSTQQARVLASVSSWYGCSQINTYALQGLTGPYNHIEEMNMKLTEKQILHFKDVEGWKNNAYKDSLGYTTIGCGHLLGKDPSAWVKYKGLRWTDEQILAQLERDVDTAVLGAKRLYPKFDTYSKDVQTALIDLVFNLGEVGLSKFNTTNALINSGQFSKAADNLLKTLWAKQVKRRAKITTDLLRAG